MARPRYVDPATLGPRQVAGYFAVWDCQREYNEHGTAYIETWRPGAVDDEVAQFGADHPWPVHWDHGAAALMGKDPEQLFTVPIGRAVTLDQGDPYGPFVIVELRDGRLADEALAAARAGDVGFSCHIVDLDPDTEDRRGRLYVTRRKLSIREITLTGRPAEPGACVVAVGSPGAPGLDLGDMRDMTDEALIAAATAMIEATGGSRAMLEMRAARDRAERRRRDGEQVTTARELALCVMEGRRRAAALQNAAAVEAGRYPPDPRRPAAVIVAEAVVEAAGARQAEAQLAELCCNDRGLIENVMREAVP